MQVLDVIADSPAYTAGMKDGDIIISLGHEPVKTVDDIHRRLTRDAIGTSLEITVLRDWTTRLEKEIMPGRNPD